MITRSRRPLASILTAALVVGGVMVASDATVVPANAHARAASAATRAGSGTVTFAQTPTYTPNYIFPLDAPAYYSVANLALFQYLMYRPLYWFDSSGHVAFNQQLSLASPPVWSRNGRTIEIRLKAYRWSNGETVNATDLLFWEHLIAAEKHNYGGYVTGDYPDNVTAIRALGPSTVQLTLNRPYAHTWFLFNELSQVTPLPEAWDKTSGSAAPGSGGCAADVAKCPAVYAYLAGQAKQTGTYATNPLWQVVDGPWKLSKFLASTGYAAFVVNHSYSGSVKPTLSKFIEVPFTSELAEFDAVLAGSVDVGYLPVTDVAEKARVKSLGYTISPWVEFGYNSIRENLYDPTTGPIVRQLYVRQALQYVMDQPAAIRVFYHGYATPSYGPVPISPPNPFVTPFEARNPYPFSVSTARHLLISHGWAIEHGVATCTHPGSGRAQCGAGIRRGTLLELQIVDATGYPELTSAMEAYKSDASGAGIVINLRQAPIPTVNAMEIACHSGPQCNWQAGNAGPWTYFPDYLPTGGEIFACGAGGNVGSYCNPTNDANIAQTHLAPPAQFQAVFARYENYIAAQVPNIWEPLPDFQITLVRRGLVGVLPQEPTLVINPESWRWRS